MTMRTCFFVTLLLLALVNFAAAGWFGKSANDDGLAALKKDAQKALDNVKTIGSDKKIEMEKKALRAQAKAELKAKEYELNAKKAYKDASNRAKKAEKDAKKAYKDASNKAKKQYDNAKQEGSGLIGDIKTRLGNIFAFKE